MVVKKREGVAAEARRENTMSEVWFSEHYYRCSWPGYMLVVHSGLDQQGVSL